MLLYSDNYVPFRGAETFIPLNAGIEIFMRFEGGTEPLVEFHIVVFSVVVFTIVEFPVVVFQSVAFQFGMFQFGEFPGAIAGCINVIQSSTPTNMETLLIPFLLIFLTPLLFNYNQNSAIYGLSRENNLAVNISPYL